MKTQFKIIGIFVVATSLFLLLWRTFRHEPVIKTGLKPYERYQFIKNYPDYNTGSKPFLKELARASKAARKSAEIESNKSVKWKTAGPYNFGGRFNTIAHNQGNDHVIYAGSANGGIFKTIDGGKNWNPIFDDYSYLSIGHILISPHDANTIFVGTGDPNISGYPWVGNGVYKSTDAGATWQHLGLDSVGIVSKIAVHPKNGHIIYVATMGIPFERNLHRGLYKSVNGGLTWKNVLFLSNEAGIIDLVMHAENPDTIFVAGWNRIKNYDESVSTGSASKIYRTFDGGNSWKTMENGLPQGNLCRTGLALVSKPKVKIIAQIVNAKLETEGIYQTDDFGDTWTKLAMKGLASDALGGFGWYFGKFRINPFKQSEYYVLGVDLHKSGDQGKNFKNITGLARNEFVHADKHDLVFIDSVTFILATDGGLYKTTNAGTNWEDIEDIANTQFYRVSIDRHNKNYYCGGAQDNGTLYGSATDSANWQRLLGGDGFQPIFDWQNSSIVYAESQRGYLYSGSRTNQNIQWSNFVDGLNENDRPWDMPFCMSKINSNILYAGARSVFKNSNGPRGKWNKISNDLTDGTNPLFHFITAIDVSPFSDELILVGTSNGKVRLYTEGLWNNITEGLPNRYVSDVFLSNNHKNSLFVSHSGYKANEYIPHLHYTNNLGKTWHDISSNLPQLGINSIYAMKGSSDSVIFVATDGGVYHTLNRGEHWERTGEGMPIIPVYDMAYDDSTETLVAATYGRSMMTIDLKSILKKETTQVSALAEKRKFKLKLYPNPANNYLNFEFAEMDAVTLTILNSEAKLVYTDNLNEDKGTISISNLQNGWYLLLIHTNDKFIEAQKFLILH